MSPIPKRYESATIEQKWQKYWEDNGVYLFQHDDNRPVYSVDTPPPTVSSENLHLGHCYSYSHPDFYVRFQRMNNKNIFYPMGWDDNGLPTERLVENKMGISPEKVGAEAFLKAIAETSKKFEENYKLLLKRMGLSVDWSFTYSTISASAHKVAQYSFIELYKKGKLYQASSPTIWCPVCRTALAQAEIADLQRDTNFYTIAFSCDGQTLPIATTRPELLPACVAVFVNPEDKRHEHLIGKKAITPVFKKEVPILGDVKADPEKGTGIVMCCTFGDTTDIKWWREHNLPLISTIDRTGRLNESGGFLAGMNVKQARKKIIEEMTAVNLVLETKATSQTVSMHDRCDTPIEYLETKQWFIKILDEKERLIEAGNKINWHPAHMHARYEDWVKNLEWDWCISRQRYHGVPFPVWYCAKCGEVKLADISELPIDPRSGQPSTPCSCGSTDFTPETSVMDTWQTSSLSPQVAGKWLDDEKLFRKVFPMTMRPQSHEIIRTWAFYTIVKALYHENTLPWSDVTISGQGLAPDGRKISKSKGNASDPNIMFNKYSADAVRYWSASSKLGEDSMVSEDKVASGHKFVNKLWNVTGFSYQFLEGYKPPASPPSLLPTDKWILSKLNRLIPEVTKDFQEYNHASAKNRIESFFWEIFTDNYMEMVKTRLYDSPADSAERESARYTLYNVLYALIKLIAPVMPFITEEIYQALLKTEKDAASIHISGWPKANNQLVSDEAEAAGSMLIDIATAVRRYKSEKKLPMGSPLEKLSIAAANDENVKILQTCLVDIKSVTRAKEIQINTGKIDVAVSVQEIL